MAGTPVATGVVPLFVPTNATDQTAGTVRFLTKALLQNTGYGVLGEGSFTPTPNSSQARTAAGTAFVPATSGYYLVRTTTTKNMVPEINNDVATRTDELVLEVNETTEVAQLTIYKSGDTKSHPYIPIAEVDVAPGGSTTVTAVRDIRYRSQSLLPTGYHTYSGRKGLSSYGSAGTTNETGNLSDSGLDPSGMLDSSKITPKIAGLYLVTISFRADVLPGQWVTAILNEGSTTATTNIVLSATAAWGGSGTLLNYGAGASSLLYLGTNTTTNALRVFTITSSAATVHDLRVSLNYIAPKAGSLVSSINFGGVYPS